VASTSKDGALIVLGSMGLAVPGRPADPVRSLVAEDWRARGVRGQRGPGNPTGPSLVHVWSTLHGTEWLATVSSGASLRRSPMRSWGNRPGQNP